MSQNIAPEQLTGILTAALALQPTKPLVLALDGRCGSGKTTLAAALAGQFPASTVLHTDDFYLPPADRAMCCSSFSLKRCWFAWSVARWA